MGVTVIGVLVELLLTDSPMSRFVRSIYAFFILFVIVQPLPGFFRNGVTFDLKPISVNTKYIDDMTTQRVEAALLNAGITATVSINAGRVVVRATNATQADVETIIQIVVAVTGLERGDVEVII